jgi:hypothetical protein
VLALGHGDPRVSAPVLREIALEDHDPRRVATAVLALMTRDPHGAYQLIGQVMERDRGDEELRLALYRLMAGEPLEPGEDGTELAGRYRERLAPRVETVFHGSETDEKTTELLLSEIEREFGDRGSPELRIHAADALVKLKGEAAAQTYGRILESLPTNQRIQLVTRIDLVENPEMLVEAVRVAPDSELEYRRFLAGLLETPGRSDLLARLWDWRRDERDPAIRQDLDKAIFRMEEALR